MTTYAKDTSVSVEKSRAEIERTLARFGASHFLFGSAPGGAVIEFIVGEWRVRFNMKLPDKFEDRFAFRTVYGRKKENPADQREKLWEAECRSYWRALALLVKAKLASVEANITSFEEEFLAHLVVQVGPGKTQTAAEAILPKLIEANKTGKLPPLLPSGLD
jgi:hypothetical protein